MSWVTDYIDDEFWQWFDQNASTYMLMHRLDILQAFYDAYKKGFKTREGKDAAGHEIVFGGTDEEFEMFSVFRFITPTPPPQEKRSNLPKGFEAAFIDHMNKKLKEERNEKDS